MSRKMRDSGIAWIGDVPEGWGTTRLKYLCKITTGDQDTQDADIDGEYPFYVRSPIVERSSKFTFDGDGILMAGDGAGAGRIFHEAHGKYAVHQRVYRMFEFKDIIMHYFWYFISMSFPRVMDGGSAQSTVPSVRLPMLQNLAFYLPPLPEQKAIAGYLDDACGKMDGLREKVERQIAALEEYKKSVITEAVTGKAKVEIKGIGNSEEGISAEGSSFTVSKRDPKTMKPSGVEWIGDVPEGWKSSALKHYLSAIKDGTHGTYQRVDDGEYLLSAKNICDSGIVISERDSKIAETDYDSIVSNGYPKRGDVLMCIVGTIGRCCLFECDRPLAFQRSVAILRVGNKLWNRYLCYVLKSKAVEEQEKLSAIGSAQLGLYLGAVCELKVPLPPLPEQKAIAGYLDKKCAAIDATVAKCRKQLDNLAEYKKSLIYECVTGKRKVA